ncbi:MAG: molybdopterin-guanine dinucleotide biosynthesis protein B [bacterium]|nr:molybdopterin-guanine dinucleotide biosynthesis protein B [bacterium]
MAKHAEAVAGGEPSQDLSTSGPVLAFCGWSGSGKTTLLEALIPRLRRRGLAVALIKHDAHGVQLDTPGKDSDRFFKAGATVCLRGPKEVAWRYGASASIGFRRCVRDLLRHHDLVLVEGHKHTPLPKVWIAARNQPSSPESVHGILATLPWSSDRTDEAEEIVMSYMEKAFATRRVLGGVLVGGASRRMGRPKQLINIRGNAMIEHVAAALAPTTDNLVLLGDGAVPASIEALLRLPDVADCTGPMAGLLAAMRWAPDSTWLVAACDLPQCDSATALWLLSQRRQGAWAVMPQFETGVEPLLAVYEPQALGLLEDQYAADELAPRLLAQHEKVYTPRPPPELEGAWRNVNTEQELAVLMPGT